MSRMSSRVRRAEAADRDIDGLGNLHADWCMGATILAGTALCPPPPPPLDFWKECRNFQCRTLVRGQNEDEALRRLIAHMSKCTFGAKVKRLAA